MIGDDPTSFAAAIVELYTDEELWQRVADNSHRRIEKHFTPQVIAETIHRSIKDLSQSGSKVQCPLVILDFGPWTVDFGLTSDRSSVRTKG